MLQQEPSGHSCASSFGMKESQPVDEHGATGQPTPPLTMSVLFPGTLIHPAKWLIFALQLPKPGDFLPDVAFSHWNYLLFDTGVAWHFFCRFVPGSKTSWLALLITLAYHSDVYFLVFTMVSLWRTKPCTRNSLFTETLIPRIWCIPYLQINLKRQS